MPAEQYQICQRSHRKLQKISTLQPGEHVSVQVTRRVTVPMVKNALTCCMHEVEVLEAADCH